MGNKEQLAAALESVLEAGERIEAWRPVVANGRVEDSAYQTTLALLGPSVFSRHAQGAIANSGEMPDRTNLVIVTDRRVLWCNKSRFNGEIVVGGSDSLGSLHLVSVTPARIALAKLLFTFHDRSVVQFDLPSDHKAAEFATDIQRLLLRVPTAA
jgi:hypothetical protein